MAVADASSTGPRLFLGRLPRGRLDLPTHLRLALLALCAVLSAATGGLPETLPWLLALLLVGGVESGTKGRHRTVAAALVAVEVATVCLGIAYTGLARSALLPYLLGPMASTGRRFGNRGVAAMTALGALGLLLGALTLVRPGRDATDVVGAVQWLALGLASGLLAAWAERLRALRQTGASGYVQAQRLLSQLRAVAQKLPGSLDPASAADSLLDRCGQIAPYERAVVLTRYDGSSLVPVAIHGVDRVPWRDPVHEPGTLRTAWTQMRTVLDVRQPDGPGGRRRGSSLLVVPFRATDGSPLGLVAFESTKLDAFDGPVVADIEAQVLQDSPRIETAMLFADLRHTATLEERERLAREMHNGVAQDLAYFGFALDDLRHRLSGESPEMAARVAGLRGELTEMIQDIRLSITDLRSSIGPERGLGTALSSYVRLAGSAAGLTVNLSLKESYLRLPAAHEMALFRLTQAFVTHVRKAAKAESLWVTLETDPPKASLLLEHDGQPADESGGYWADLDEVTGALAELGGSLSVSVPEPGRLRVHVTLTGGTQWRSDSSSSTTTP